MKKLIVLATAFFTAAASFAGGDKTGAFSGIQRDKDIIDNGFYLHVGLGLPSIADEDSESLKLGFQPTFEIGNQWMFYKSDAFGIGMNVSWLTFGYSSKTETYGTGGFEYDVKTGAVYLSFLKFGPMASIAANDEMAFDVILDFSPTVYFGASQVDDEDLDNGFIMSGIAISPAVKFRYKKLSVGFETQFGKLNYANTNDDFDDADFKASYFNPRLLVGFKF